MEEFAVVDNYLRRGRYPEGLSKEEKANLRRKCRKNFLTVRERTPVLQEG